MELPIDDIATCFRVNKLLSLRDITSDYNHLVAFVKGDQCFSKNSDNHIAKLFHGVMDDLSVRTVDNTDLVILHGTRIVVPFPARKFVIRELHNAHSGLTKSILIAQQLYYWPSMRFDIKSTIDACVPCQQAQPSQARQKLLPPVSPSHTLQPRYAQCQLGPFCLCRTGLAGHGGKIQRLCLEIQALQYDNKTCAFTTGDVHGLWMAPHHSL